MAMTEMNYMSGGGGGMTLAKQTETIAATTRDVTFSGLTNIQCVVGYHADGIIFGYYDDDDSQYHFLTSWAAAMKINSISNNIVSVTSSTTRSFDFYAFGT